MVEPTPGKHDRAPRAKGRTWGPGAPGQRVPALQRISIVSDVDVRRLFAIGAMLLFLVVYMLFGRPHHDASETLEAAGTAPVGTGSHAETVARGRPFQGLLENAVDRAPLDKIDTADPYRALLWNLKILTVAEVASRAETVTPAELLADPGQWRGQFVRLTGVLVAPLTVRRLPKNEAGLDVAWRGLLVDTSAGDDAAVAFDLFEKPPVEPEARRLALTLDGVFLQVVSYETRTGRVRQVPFLQAKSLTVVEGSRVSQLGQSPETYFMLGALICLLLPIAGLVVNRWVSRRREHGMAAALDRIRVKRMNEARARAKAKAAAAAPPASTAAPAPDAAAAPPPSAPSAPPPSPPPAPPSDAPPPAPPAAPPSAPPATPPSSS